MNRIYFTAAVIAALLASCSADDAADEGAKSAGKEKIELTMSVSPATRAAQNSAKELVASVSQLSDDELKYCAQLTGFDLGVRKQSESGTVTTDNCRIDRRYSWLPMKTPWTWEGFARYDFYGWSVRDDYMSQHADAWSVARPDVVHYAPHTGTSYTASKLVNGATDLLYTYASATGCTEGNAPVSLTFEHALAKVDVQFTEKLIYQGQYGAVVSPKNLAFSGVRTSGTCTIQPTVPATCRWSDLAGDGTLSGFYDNSSSTNPELLHYTGTAAGTQHETLVTPFQFVIPANEGAQPSDLQDFVITFTLGYCDAQRGWDSWTAKTVNVTLRVKADAYVTEGGARRYIAAFLPGHHYRFLIDVDENMFPKEQIGFNVTGVNTFEIGGEITLGAPQRTRATDEDGMAVECIPLVVKP